MLPAVRRILYVVALLLVVGAILIGAGQGRKPCAHRQIDGISYNAHCTFANQADQCCETNCQDQKECVSMILPPATIAGAVIIIVGVFLLLWIPIMRFVSRHKTTGLEDLDRNPKLDKFRRASLEAKKASLIMQQSGTVKHLGTSKDVKASSVAVDNSPQACPV